MATFEGFRKHWLWAFVAFLLSISVAIGALYLQYRSTLHELGGSLNATFHSLYLNNRESRTIVVCMEDTSVDLNNLYVTPTFDNSKEYSLKDFSLTYDAVCSNVVLVPSSFVDAHEYGNNEYIFKYKDNVLAAHDDTKKPFSKFVLNNSQGRCYIKTKASFDGAESAFEYNTDVWFFVVPNKSSLSYEDWKINCKKRIFEFITDKYYDVYFYARNHETEYQFDVALHNNNNQIETPATKQQDASASLSAQNIRKEPATETKPTRQKTESTQSESKKVAVPVAANDNDQDLSLAQFSSSFDGKEISVELKFNKSASEDAMYLLYGHYTTAETEDPQIIFHPIHVKAGIDSYQFIYRNSVKYEFKDDMRIIPQSNAENLVDYSQWGESTKILSKSNNDVAVVIYTSSDSYRFYMLSPGGTYYANAVNKIMVFDTGVRRNKEDVPLNERINAYVSNLGFWSIVIYIICFFGYTFFFFGIGLFFSELKDRRSFSEAWYEFKQTFSLDYLSETLMSKEDSFGTKCWLVFCFLSPIFAIVYTIYFIVTI